MNTHGHHDCAETAGEPLLREAFERAGVPKARLGAFYLGNWLTDVSQAVDPVAYMAFRYKVETPQRWIDSVITEVRNHVLYQLATSTKVVSDAELMEPVNEAKATIRGAFDRFFGDGDGSRDNTLGQAFKTALFSAGYFKFVHPEGPDTMAYEEGYRRVFEERFTQYYPHEHLDRPEKKYRPSEAQGQSMHPEAASDFSQEIGGGLRSLTGGKLKLEPDMYEYLRDDIEIAAALIAEVDRDWASTVFRGGVEIDDESPEYNMYLAMLGHALHAVEDFFAHSNFIEHAVDMFGAKEQPELFQLRSKEVVQRRLTKWSNPGDEDRNDLDRLGSEKHVVTGFFDFQDTLISLLHLLEEVFDANTMGLGDQLHELHKGVESAPAHAQEKYNEYKRVLTETLEILDDPRHAFDDASNGTAQDLKNEYEEAEKQLSPNPIPEQVARDVVSITPLFEDVPPEVVENFVLACKHFGTAKAIHGYTTTLYGAIKTIATFIASPWAFVTDTLRELGLDWAADLVKHYAKQVLYDWVGQMRIGCHSLIAKDHGTEPLYNHQKQCALSVHYYVMKLLVRHAEPDVIDGCRANDDASGTEQLNTIDSRTWIDWLEVLEYFLRHPRAVLTTTREEVTRVEYSRTHTVEQGSGDSLASLSRQYSPTAVGGELTWQRLADVNFDTEGLPDSERQRVINACLRDRGTGHLVDDRGNYAFNPGYIVRIPDQVADVPTRVVAEDKTSWFREVIENKTWEVFKGWEDAATQTSRLAIEHHTPVYITKRELDNLIDSGSKLRGALEKAYVPDGARPLPAPSEAKPATRYDYYRKLIEGAGVFDAEEGCVNIIGVRGFQNGKKNKNKSDEYNDTIAVVWFEHGHKRCHEFVASVDPGEKFTKDPLVTEGCAHLIDGQYSYKWGIHGKKRKTPREALVEAAEVSVWRDSDSDHQQDKAEHKVYTSRWYGIHIHAGGTKEHIGGWSAGCQIIKGGWNGVPWKTFKEVCHSHPKPTLSYTLVDAAEAVKHDYPFESDDAADHRGDEAGEEAVVTLLDVQKALNALGFKDYESKALAEDGDNGPRTKSAVKMYQNSRRLAVNGTADQNTKDRLGQDIRGE